MFATHLDSLRYLLSTERSRLEAAKTDGERELRAVWVSQLEREIEFEMALHGTVDNLPEMTDDELYESLK
jgi:hypothetical protein